MYYEAGQTKWGLQIPDSAKRFSWFKLDLDPSHPRNLFSLATGLPDTQAIPLSDSISAEKLTVDYLTALRKHIDLVLEKSHLKSSTDGIPVVYIITVPAVWTHAAQAKTLACAERAGFGDAGKVQIVSEPEAAAIYALDTMETTNFTVGDTFVVCDAG